MSWNTEFLTLPLDTGSPALGASQIRSFKTEIQGVVDNEHEFDETEVSTQGYHKAGSARALKDAFTTTPATNPFAIEWNDYDVGRLYINTTDGGLQYVDSQTGGVATFKELFEASDIDDTAGTTTTTNLQDKINALANRIVAITGSVTATDAWKDDPSKSIADIDALIDQSVVSGANVTFGTIASGNITSSGTIASGAITSSGALSCTTINTGPGATNVHLMNQNLRSVDSPTFGGLTVSGDFRPKLGTISLTSKSIAGNWSWTPPAGWYIVHRGNSQIHLGSTGDGITTGTYYFDGALKLENESSTTQSVGYGTYS